MLKGFFLGIISLFMFDSNQSTIKPNLLKRPVCRVTCTISVPDGFGGSIGVSATAGNFFTSCEKARGKACEKAGRKIMSAIF